MAVNIIDKLLACLDGLVDGGDEEIKGVVAKLRENKDVLTGVSDDIVVGALHLLFSRQEHKMREAMVASLSTDEKIEYLKGVGEVYEAEKKRMDERVSFLKEIGNALSKWGTGMLLSLLRR